MNIKWNDFRTNAEVRAESKQEYVTSFIRRRCWNYVGHVLRMDVNRLPKQAVMWKPAGKRKVGRPKETLGRIINRESSILGIDNTQELQQIATNRQIWREITSALRAVFGPRGNNYLYQYRIACSLLVHCLLRKRW